MLTVDDALGLVLEHSRPKTAGPVALEEALGLVLAEDIASDVDSPPHDKAIVDGYAVRAADVASSPRELRVTETITAGLTPRKSISAGEAARVMTGAPIPKGADAAVMLEVTRTLAAENGLPERVVIEGAGVQAGQNIMPRAASMRKGEIVLRRGAPIRPIEIGLLAEVGRTQVSVHSRPQVAVMPTGNELVSGSKVPAPGQIRNSNGPMLLALAQQCGADATDLGIGRDEPEQLRELLSRGLAADVMVVSGGVSAGVLDLVPGVLAEIGVREVFHKVRLKPGKPLWFGIYEKPGGPALVFGLPGNPVSSFVCFELFVRPAINCLAGRRADGLRRGQAQLTHDFHHRGDRPTYHPAHLSVATDGFAATLLAWKGSGDLRTLADANALAHFPAGNHTFEAGSSVETLEL